MPARTQMAMLRLIGYICYVQLLYPIAGGEVARSLRATRTSTPRTIVVLLSHADVYKLDL